jgi:tetratricopeptide (TPR) repeat protein
MRIADMPHRLALLAGHGPVGEAGRAGAAVVPPAAHRAIVCVDVEGFGDQRRTTADQVAVREGLYGALGGAFARSGVRWADCYREDRGDGVLVLVPPQVLKAVLVTRVPLELAAALARYNRGRGRAARIRLRMAVHAGEVVFDRHGVAATAVNHAFRLLEAEAVKDALAGSQGVLAVIVSRWLYDEVVRHDPACGSASYRRVLVSVKETRDDAWICLPDNPYPPEPGAWLSRAPEVAVPRQLPGAVRGFAGREVELGALSALLDQAAETGGAVVISAIGGTAGIGKTALALTWAHQVAARFPDGQLYVNLRGFDPAGAPASPAEVVRGFLDAFEVPAGRIPVSLDAQAALYRSLLAGRRVLVVLDNARDAAQVRPLLPGAPGCMVIITSRSQLTSLITAESARSMTLDLLTPGEARQLLAGRLGPDRVAAEPEAAGQIITSCARLPLALAIVAARAVTHPQFPLAALARELRDTSGSLEAFGGDADADARTVFSWSYDQLSSDAARLFRLLGLHPGPDISVHAAASLAGVPPQQARPWLAELARAHLLTEQAPGRFSFHDLLRAYAGELACARDPAAQRQAAMHRMLDYYLHTSHAAAMELQVQWSPITLAAPQPGVATQAFPGHPAAWAWFEAEYPVLLAAIQLAAATGFGTHAWQLPCAMHHYFERQGQWRDWADTHQTALAAARRQGDREGQARAHAGLGCACHWTGPSGEARVHLRQALHLFEQLGDQLGQAMTHLHISGTFEREGHLQEALSHTYQILALTRAAAYRRGQACALANIGWIHVLLGDPHQALTHCEQALALKQGIHARHMEGALQANIGYVHYQLGHPERAIGYLEQGLAISRELGDRSREATVLTHLGDAHHSAGHVTAARESWRQALTVLGGFSVLPSAGTGASHPSADQIRARLRAGEALRPLPEIR